MNPTADGSCGPRRGPQEPSNEHRNAIATTIRRVR